MVYDATPSETQRVIRWQLILEYFGPTIQYIAGVDNTVADKLSILTSTSVNKYEPSTRKAQFYANKLFAINGSENNEDGFPQKLLNVQREQKKS